jgi:hypothetical protein
MLRVRYSAHQLGIKSTSRVADFFDREADLLKWRLRETKRCVESMGMRAIQPGEHWKVSVGGEVREVKVTGAGETPGSWKCVDVETGLTFYASYQWFVEPVEILKREGNAGR